jgi:DNA primase
VASCGTALTAEHARLLKRYAGRLLLLFDQDSAGRKATFRAMDVLLSEGLSAAVVQLDAGEDPDSFLRKHGSQPFRDRLRAARPVLDVFIDAVLTEHGSSIEGKARAIEQIMAKLRLLSSDIEKSLYLKDLAGRTGIDPELLARKIPSRPDRPLQVSRPQRKETKTRGAAFKAQEWLLYLMLTDGPSRQRVVLEGVETLFFEENCLAVARQVVGMAGQEEKMDEKRLFDALDEEQKAILSGILIKDEKAFADDAERIFEDCRLMAAKEKLKRRFRELSDLLRGGNGGDSDEYRTLLQRELIDIKKQLEAR